MPPIRVLELLQDSCDPPLTRDAVRALELELGVQFPTDYVAFLLNYNGGRFVRPVSFDIPNATKNIAKSRVERFLGESGDPQNGTNLKWNVKFVADRFPRGYLAIADCLSDDYVLLKFVGSGASFAGVWYWDGPGFYLPENGPNVYWLADSFTEFLAMLYYDEVAYEYIHEWRETLELFQAIECGNEPVLQQYLASGGDVNAVNERGQSLISVATRYWWPKMVRLLLQHLADPNMPDHQGKTPLHHAASHSMDIVKLLLAAGAVPTARDKAGNSVLAGWSYEVDQLLRASGAQE